MTEFCRQTLYSELDLSGHPITRAFLHSMVPAHGGVLMKMDMAEHYGSGEGTGLARWARYIVSHRDPGNVFANHDLAVTRGRILKC